MHLQQDSAETMQAYATRVRSYVQDLLLYKPERAVFRDTDLIQHFVDGLHQPALKPDLTPIVQLFPQTLQTLDFVMQRAIRNADRLKIKMSSATNSSPPVLAVVPPAPSAQSSPAGASSSYFCHYCKRTGHTIKYCRKKRQADQRTSGHSAPGAAAAPAFPPQVNAISAAPAQPAPPPPNPAAGPAVAPSPASGAPPAAVPAQE
eukprot:765291-Hanusia_phi.AAC.3